MSDVLETAHHPGGPGVLKHKLVEVSTLHHEPMIWIDRVIGPVQFERDTVGNGSKSGVAVVLLE